MNKIPFNYISWVYGNPHSYNIGISRMIYILLFNVIAILVFSLAYIYSNITLGVFIGFSTLIITLTMLKPSDSNLHSVIRGKDRKNLLRNTILGALVFYSYFKYLNYKGESFEITDIKSIVITLLIIYLFLINGIKTQIRTYKNNKDGKYPNIFNPRKILVILLCLAGWIGVFSLLN